MVADDLKQALKPGALFAGKYRLGPALGEGGMGLVLSATHELTRERVALKILLARGDRGDLARQRFVNEARAAVQIKSEHVARVLDADVTADGVSFLVIELLEGRDLRRLLAERGPLPPGDAVSYAMQACEALAEAHALGIIHRDIKPDNLFVTRRKDGSELVKVLDFGISKQVRPGDPRLTRTRSAMGSPMYMAPEQMLYPKDADERSDLWSLGVTLFELLTAAAPFAAETPEGLAIEIATRPHPPLLSLRPGLPPALGAVVDRCLSKVPALRFASARELACALADLGLPLDLPPASSPDLAPGASLATLDPDAPGPPPAPSGPGPLSAPPGPGALLAPSDPAMPPALSGSEARSARSDSGPPSALSGPPRASLGPGLLLARPALPRWPLWAAAALLALALSLLLRTPPGSASQGDRAQVAPAPVGELGAQAPASSPAEAASFAVASTTTSASVLSAAAPSAAVPAAAPSVTAAAVAAASGSAAPAAAGPAAVPQAPLSRPQRKPGAQATKKTQGLPDFGGR